MYLVAFYNNMNNALLSQNLQTLEAFRRTYKYALGQNLWAAWSRMEKEIKKYASYSQDISTDEDKTQL